MQIKLECLNLLSSPPRKGLKSSCPLIFLTQVLHLEREFSLELTTHQCVIRHRYSKKSIDSNPIHYLKADQNLTPLISVSVEVIL